jgi:hypothetical protein
MTWGPSPTEAEDFSSWVPVVLSPGVKCGRGVTLTTHPIWCRGQERIGAVRHLSLKISDDGALFCVELYFWTYVQSQNYKITLCYNVSTAVFCFLHQKDRKVIGSAHWLTSHSLEVSVVFLPDDGSRIQFSKRNIII